MGKYSAQGLHELSHFNTLTTLRQEFPTFWQMKKLEFKMAELSGHLGVSVG